MDKQLVQDIIKVGNKVIERVPIKYTVDTKDGTFYGYNGLYYNNDHVEFEDDYGDEIVLSYDEIVGIKIGNL